MEFNYFDLVASIVILFLGLKGIINGFFKEVFGLIGIVGGIFIASRLGDKVGQYISDTIFKFESSAAIGFSGFLLTLVLFWLLMIVTGQIFKKLGSMSGLGPIDKILGFVFGASKFFLIAAVIAHAAYNIKALKNSVDPMLSTSILFPVLVETGSYIMKLDPVEISDDLNNTITQQSKNIEDSINKNVETSATQIIKNVKDDLKDAMPKAAKDI